MATPRCSSKGINKRTGRLKKGYRWAKGRKGCAIPVKPKKGKKKSKKRGKKGKRR